MKRFSRWHTVGFCAVAIASSAFGADGSGPAKEPQPAASQGAPADPLKEAIEAERNLVERLARLEEHHRRAANSGDQAAMRELEDTVSAWRLAHVERMQRMRMTMSPADRESLERFLIEEREVRTGEKAAAAARERARAEGRTDKRQDRRETRMEKRHERSEARMEQRHDRQEAAMEKRHDWRSFQVERRHDRQEQRVADRVGEAAAEKLDARHDQQEAEMEARQDRKETGFQAGNANQEARTDAKHDRKETRADKRKESRSDKRSSTQKQSGGSSD